MTNKEFIKQIRAFKKNINEAGITMANGEEVKDIFFRHLLGVGESTFKKMIYGQESMRPIQPYIAKHIRTLTLLESDVFLNEVRNLVRERETDK